MTHHICPARSSVRQDLGCVVKAILIIIWGGGRVKGAVSHRWKKQGATPTELVDGFNSSTSLARMLSCAHRIVQFIVIALSRPNDSGKKTASITIKLFQNENCSGF